MKKVLFLLFLLLLFVTDINAKYVQTCVVRYMTEEGWSKKYTVDVTFLTGQELNDATNTYKYSTYSTYAIIFWNKEQVTIIKLSSYTSCGSSTDKSCITGTYNDLKGKDQDNDEWKICVNDYC